MARATIPLFPLGSVLYPGLALPLHIFEQRYRLLVARLEAGTTDEERSFGVVAIRAGHEVGSASVSALHQVGTTALLRRVTRYPDGRSDILTTGARRFRLLDVDRSQPYLLGEVEWLPEAAGTSPGLDSLAAGVAAQFTTYQQTLAGDDGEDADDASLALPDDPTVLSYLISAAMVLDLADRQRLLATPSTADRLRRLSGLLTRELTALRLLGAVPATDLLRSGISLN